MCQEDACTNAVVNESIIENKLKCFGQIKMINDSRLVKQMYSGEGVGNLLVDK